MSSSFNCALGSLLRRRRMLHGLTQSQLARQLGVSFQQVQKYEAGANSMSFERVCALSALLSVPLADWAEAAGSEAASATEHGGRQGLSLLRAFHAIGNDERRVLLCQIARVMAESTESA